MREFLEEVERGEYGESGPQKPGTRTIVTQYSLDHYMAQQWNLEVDNFPASLPDHLKAVQDMFTNYNRRAVG